MCLFGFNSSTIYISSLVNVGGAEIGAWKENHGSMRNDENHDIMRIQVDGKWDTAWSFDTIRDLTETVLFCSEGSFQVLKERNAKMSFEKHDFVNVFSARSSTVPHNSTNSHLT